MASVVRCNLCTFNRTYDNPQHAKSAAHAHARTHERDPSLAYVYALFPSLEWGVEEWKAVLDVRGDIIDAIADDIMRANQRGD